MSTNRHGELRVVTSQDAMCQIAERSGRTVLVVSSREGEAFETVIDRADLHALIAMLSAYQSFVA